MGPCGYLSKCVHESLRESEMSCSVYGLAWVWKSEDGVCAFA